MTTLWHKRWYQDMHHDDMVCMLWEVWSLMCTSDVANNTQMASLDRQVTQNGLGVNNAIARGIYNGVVEVTVLCNDEWRCSWCRYQDDGDSSLSSRNTLGNGKTANSKSQTSNGGSGNAVVLLRKLKGIVKMQWWVLRHNAEVEGKVMVYYTWCRSWKHGP